MWESLEWKRTCLFQCSGRMAEENHTKWSILELDTSSAEATDCVPAQDGWTSGGARVPGSSSPPLSTHQHCLVTGWHWMGLKLPSFSWHCGRYSCLAGIPVSWAWCSRMARLCWHAKTWGWWWVTQGKSQWLGCHIIKWILRQNTIHMHKQFPVLIQGL